MYFTNKHLLDWVTGLSYRKRLQETLIWDFIVKKKKKNFLPMIAKFVFVIYVPKYFAGYKMRQYTSYMLMLGSFLYTLSP